MFNRLNLKDIRGIVNTDTRSGSSREVRNRGYKEVHTYAIEPNHNLLFHFLHA